MNSHNHKPVIGIVGPVGAGKSTVAKQFARLGCAVIDADKISHEVLNSPEIVAKVGKIFGTDVLGSDQKIVNRHRLGELVFDDKEKLDKLTQLLYPHVFKREQELLSIYQLQDDVKAIVLDEPLLLELNRQHLCDCVVLVTADEHIRLERLAKNRGWTTERIKKIENLQFMLDNKAKMSEYTVINNSDIPDLALQVARILSLVLCR